MTQRKFVVYEADAAAPGGGRMYAIDPSNAGGVPIPAFRLGTTLPAVPPLNGQGFFNTADGKVYVASAGAWQSVTVAPSMVTITQTAYDALTPPNPNVLYLITGP